MILFVRYIKHFPVVQFQNQAHIRNPHGTGQVFKTIWGAAGAPFFFNRHRGRRKPNFFFLYRFPIDLAPSGIPFGAKSSSACLKLELNIGVYVAACRSTLAKHPPSTGFPSPSREAPPSAPPLGRPRRLFGRPPSLATVKEKKHFKIILGRLRRPKWFEILDPCHEDSECVLGFEIGQRESGFYSERTKSQTE